MSKRKSSTERRSSTKRNAAAALIAVAAALALLLPPAAAEATSYRFWIYWTGVSGDWDFASQGASRRPADGSVEGWRFAVSEEVGSSATPRLSPSFQQICGSTQPVEGKKRVGLVIDFGTDADAPAGQSPPNGPVARCVVAPTTASGYEILASVTSLRVDAGMICGVGGYPTSGCGEAVKSPKPTKLPEPNPSGNNSGGPSAPSTNPPESNTSAGSGSGRGGDGAGGNKGNDPDDAGGADDKKSDSRKDKDRLASDEPTPTEQESADAAIAAASSNALPTTSSGSPIGALVGAAVIATLIGAAIWFTRRRRTTT